MPRFLGSGLHFFNFSFCNYGWEVLWLSLAFYLLNLPMTLGGLAMWWMFSTNVDAEH
jgi:hypothetical protein